MACIWYGVLCCMVLNLIDILGIDSKWCGEIDWCLKILRPYTYISSLDPQRCRRTAATKAHPSQSLYSDGTSNPAGRMITFFGSFWVKLTDKDLASPYRRSLWDTCPTNLPLRQWLSVMPPPCTGHSQALSAASLPLRSVISRHSDFPEAHFRAVIAVMIDSGISIDRIEVVGLGYELCKYLRMYMI